jgi:hypothetical protein
MGQGCSRGRGEREPEVLPGNGPPLNELCEDVLFEIAARCGVREIGRLRQTCRFFHDLFGESAALLWAKQATASFSALDRGWRSIASR